jgi:TM2 domain-containing membrane protein YozV
MGYLLWIFGFMGAHRFYYGRPISGTIWFFTLGLLFVGWIIDLLLIPGMNDDADYRYLEGDVDYNIAWILLTFLGAFGIHRFYMGKVLTKRYSMIFATTPAPTVRPPSRIAKRRPSSIAIGAISVATICTLSPGITISTPSGSSTAPVTSVVRK